MLEPTLEAIAHIYGYVVDIYIDIYNHISLWAKDRYKERKKKFGLN